MVKGVSNNFAKVRNVRGWTTCLIAAVALMLGLSGNESAQATTGGSPYVVPQVKDRDDNPSNGIETWIVAEGATVDIGNGVKANAMAFKSCSDATLKNCTPAAIPGPEFRLKVNDRVIVHFVNKLRKSNLTPEANVSGIHWHGIELNNASDGTEVTQHAVDPNGGTFDYDFIVKRPGIFWYHPHHHASTNQVAKGLYGSIIVTDPYEIAGVLPSATQTKTLVLSDITVCKDPGSNPATFDSTLPHISGIGSWASNYQIHEQTQSPFILCEQYPLDANGVYLKRSYRAGEVPNIQSPSLIGRMSEGFTVLTNGVQVDPRGGNSSAPDAPSSSVLANALPVQSGQGLRLQIVNPSPVRYMRLRLTANNSWAPIPLVRIGGQGGLLTSAVVEGGVVGTVDFKYEIGEILVPPAGRADVVAAIPNLAVGSVLTLWTEDFQRVADTYSWTPTVPVMHLKVNSSTSPGYNISAGTVVRSVSVPSLGTLAGELANPNLAGETPYEQGGSAGSTDHNIQLTFNNNNGALQPSIDGIGMPRDFNGGFGTGNPFYLASARHTALGNVVELTVENTTAAHHPFHLHGFSFQPTTLNSPSGLYSFPTEFLDIVDVPAFSTLKFRVSLDERPSYGNTSPLGVGGGTGRWLFHCHILPHATFGMMSELHVGAH